MFLRKSAAQLLGRLIVFPIHHQRRYWYAKRMERFQAA